MSKEAMTTASDATPACANCGLYSMVASFGRTATMGSNAYRSSPRARSSRPWSSGVSMSVSDQEARLVSMWSRNPRPVATR